MNGIDMEKLISRPIGNNNTAFCIFIVSLSKLYTNRAPDQVLIKREKPYQSFHVSNQMVHEIFQKIIKLYKAQPSLLTLKSLRR